MPYVLLYIAKPPSSPSMGASTAPTPPPMSPGPSAGHQQPSSSARPSSPHMDHEMPQAAAGNLTPRYYLPESLASDRCFAGIDQLTTQNPPARGHTVSKSVTISSGPPPGRPVPHTAAASNPVARVSPSGYVPTSHTGAATKPATSPTVANVSPSGHAAAAAAAASKPATSPPVARMSPSGHIQMLHTGAATKSSASPPVARVPSTGHDPSGIRPVVALGTTVHASLLPFVLELHSFIKK